MKVKQLKLQEMIQFSEKASDWKIIEPNKKAPYNLKSSLNGLDIHLGFRGAQFWGLFSIGIFNRENVVGEASDLIMGESTPNLAYLEDYYNGIKKSCENIKGSHLPEPRCLKKHQEEDIRRIRRAIK